MESVPRDITYIPYTIYHLPISASLADALGYRLYFSLSFGLFVIDEGSFVLRSLEICFVDSERVGTLYQYWELC